MLLARSAMPTADLRHCIRVVSLPHACHARQQPVFARAEYAMRRRVNLPYRRRSPRCYHTARRSRCEVTFVLMSVARACPRRRGAAARRRALRVCLPLGRARCLKAGLPALPSLPVRTGRRLPFNVAATSLLLRCSLGREKAAPAMHKAKWCVYAAPVVLVLRSA